MVIYKVTNTKNNKIYIGLSTRSLNYRKIAYKSAVKSKKLSRHAVINAMKRHGFENFIFEQIDSSCCEKSLKDKEIYWIKHFDSMNFSKGYNRSPGGDLASLETIAKRSQSLKKVPRTKEWKENIRKALLGQKHSPERRMNQSKAKLGKPAWNKGLKGIMKPNSGSFKKGSTAPIKGRKKVILDGKVTYIFRDESI